MPYNGIKARKAREELARAILEAQGKPFEQDAPLKGNYGVGSPFGMRYHPILKKWMPHTGQDYGAPAGTPIYATADGYVSASMRNDPVAGNAVYIQHPGGQQTRYLHMSKFSDETLKGGPVKKGTLLGYVGSTGRSTGPHLHYGVYDGGKAQDPSKYAMRKSTAPAVAALAPAPTKQTPPRQAPKPQPTVQPTQQPAVRQAQSQPSSVVQQQVAYQAPRLSEDEITRNLNLQQLALARLPRDLMARGFT